MSEPTSSFQAAAELRDALRPLTVPVLVSALANLVAGYLWFFFTACFGVFLTAPMLVLCAFEFLYFAQAPRMSREDLVRRTTALGAFEVILGVFNGVSFLCGIIVLVNVNRIRLPDATPGSLTLSALTSTLPPKPPPPAVGDNSSPESDQP